MRTDPERMREVCRGAGVVYNAVNIPFVQWRESFPAAIDGVLAGARAADSRMVFVDDTWMYGQVSVSGRRPRTCPIGRSTTRMLRALGRRAVLAAHTSGQVRTVIGRAPELYGPPWSPCWAATCSGHVESSETKHNSGCSV